MQGDKTLATMSKLHLIDLAGSERLSKVRREGGREGGRARVGVIPLLERLYWPGKSVEKTCLLLLLLLLLLILRLLLLLLLLLLPPLLLLSLREAKCGREKR